MERRAPSVNTMNLRFILLFTGALTLAACGGSGDGSSTTASIEGLALPDTLEVVSVDEETAGSPGVNDNNGPVDNFADGADYFADQSRAHVWDRSLEPVQQIGKILGMISQTRAEEFVNDGAYIALVDESEETVGEGSSAPGSTGQSSGSNATELNPWTVLVTRASADANQVARVWIPLIDGPDDLGQGGGAGGGGGASEPTIFAKAVVREGASDSNPYGSFELNYAMKGEPNPSAQDFERGLLASVDTVPGYHGFSHVNQNQFDQNVGSQIEVRIAEDESNGLGRVSVSDYEWNELLGEEEAVQFEYVIAYDEDYFVRQLDGGAVEIFERGEYDTNTWMYGLYHAEGPNAGERVDLAGGFPIKSGGYHGWADYWGIWTEPGFDLSDGDTVTGYLPGGVERVYEAVVAPGRLIRVAREELPLADIDQARFHYWYWDEQAQTGGEAQVEYRHDAQSGVGSFWVIAMFNEETFEWEGEDTSNDDIELELAPGDWIGFWSQTLGGNVDYVAGESVVSLQSQQFVSGEDLFDGGTSLSLYGVVDCLRAGITEQEAESGDIWQNNGQPGDLNDPYAYVFQKADRTLYFDNGGGPVAVGLVEGAEPASGFNTWGMMSGPMVDDPAVLAQLNDPWQVFQLDEFYMYETGHNEWNQYRALQRNGVPVTFDAPISFLYTHETANDANGSADNDGAKVFLQYGGFGNLWGIPHVEGDDGRWFPQFSIASGTVVGEEGEYVIKAIESELFLRASGDAPPQSLLDALDTAGSLTLPTMSDWSNPADRARPTVTDAPAVVAGEIQ